MRVLINVIAIALIAISAVKSLPVVDEPATDLIPPNEPFLGWGDADESTLATDLEPSSFVPKREVGTATLFLINIFAVKNETADDSNDVLHDDIIEEAHEVIEPLGLFLLVVEDSNETSPVSLDEVAKDLEAEGFTVEKIVKDGETRLIKVDLDSMEDDKMVAEENVEKVVKEPSRELLPPHEDATPSKLMKIRRKRHICLKCKLDELKGGHHGGGGGGGFVGGGYGGGHGGGYEGGFGHGGGHGANVVPVVVVPVAIQGGGGHGGGYGGGHGGGHGGFKQNDHGHGGGGGFQRPPQYEQPCYSCGGGGYNQPQQGGGSYSHSEAHASASSGSWNGK